MFTCEKEIEEYIEMYRKMSDVKNKGCCYIAGEEINESEFINNLKEING